MRKNRIIKDRTRDKFYTSIPNELIRSSELSSGAKILLFMMFADSDEFVPTYSDLMQRMDVSLKTFRKYIKELENVGYYKRIPNNIGGYDIEIALLPKYRVQNVTSVQGIKSNLCTGYTKDTPTQDQVSLSTSNPENIRSFSNPTNDSICSISNHPSSSGFAPVPTVNEEGNKVIIDIEEKPSMSLNEDLDIDLPDIEMNFLNKDVFSDYLTNS